MRRPASRKGSARRRGRTLAAASAARPQPGTPTVVAIGASAGGLEAIGQFLGGVPDASGLAFVVVQHLDPTHEGAMPELLQRGTRMPVTQVKDGTRVEADRLVALSGYAQPEDCERCRAAGFDANLAKPVNRDALLALLAGDRRCPVGAGTRGPRRPCRVSRRPWPQQRE